MSLDRLFTKTEEKKKELEPNKIAKYIQDIKTKDLSNKNKDIPLPKANTNVYHAKKTKWVYNYDKSLNLKENKILKTISSPAETFFIGLSSWTIWALNRDILKNEDEVIELMKKIGQKYKIEYTPVYNYHNDWFKFIDSRDKLWKYEIDEKLEKKQEIETETENKEEEIDEKIN